ncbi:hypothetical protein ACFY05_33040 [Microtetraspora fusca]|uniref:Uncharacterized protein n=1 Tax=Microtetraspora fusca TaxID=1997 RepID=A0ABW6VE76_MICFU
MKRIIHITEQWSEGEGGEIGDVLDGLFDGRWRQEERQVVLEVPADLTGDEATAWLVEETVKAIQATSTESIDYAGHPGTREWYPYGVYFIDVEASPKTVKVWPQMMGRTIGSPADGDYTEAEGREVHRRLVEAGAIHTTG